MATHDFESIKTRLVGKCIYKIEKCLKDDVDYNIPSNYTGIIRIYLRSNLSDYPTKSIFDNQIDNPNNSYRLYNKYILDCYFNYKRLIFQTSDNLAIGSKYLINKKIKKIEKIETKEYRSI